MAKTVRAIPATISRYTAAPINSRKKRRVAGYARVSTDHDDQISSYEAQVDYYTNYVTKSVSRFARNTVDSLTTVRKLKDKGIEIYFEKENIWTLDAKGELLITIMSSLAQEESRSISENVTWGHRKRFADGKVCVPYRHFLGYDKGPDGNLAVNKEQVRTVKLIYRLFLDGYTFHSIARELTSRGLKTPAGKSKRYPKTVETAEVGTGPRSGIRPTSTAGSSTDATISSRTIARHHI